MCGIAGIWGAAEEAAVREMMGRVAHRGPDAEGVHVAGGGVLGHKRLSIMDPAGGDQPILNEDGTGAIVANGEIYNFPRLRPDLEKTHTLSTTSDSEAILHLYEDRDMGAVRALDGMFAFAIAADGQLYLARDPIGIKPLYYGERSHNGSGTSLVFASELKALTGLADNVREFPPGTCYRSDSGFVPYYQVPSLEPRDWDEAQHLANVRQTLEESVAKRMMSDVPVGAFLSGGLDSSLIAVMMRTHVEELHTFSVGIEGSRDLAAARVVARHLGTIHHEYLITPEEVVEKLPEIIYHLESFDQDLVRSAIPCYFCSRLAAEHVKVILTGEGADELFAGYTYYKDIDDHGALHDELRRSVASLHNINLQRVDRLTMAHGLEARVPFLDLAMIEVGQTVPASLKLRPDGSGKPVEKWVLRQACRDLLPAEIIWRDKEQFDEGSGTVDLLTETLAEHIDGAVDAEYRQRCAEDQLRSAEEAYFHKVLTDSFSAPEAVLANVGRWSHRQT